MSNEYRFGNIRIERFVWDMLDSNMYAVFEDVHVLLIDPIKTKETLCFFEPLKNQIEDILVILTHEHYDHINGLNWLRENFKCTVCTTALCSKNIQNANRNLSAIADIMMIFSGKPKTSCWMGGGFVCDPADVVLKNGEIFDWHNFHLKIYETPGHSQGSACIVLNEEILFSGDTILETGIVTKLPGGSKKEYYNKTLPALYKLLDITKIVFPGHGEDMDPEAARNLIHNIGGAIYV